MAALKTGWQGKATEKSGSAADLTLVYERLLARYGPQGWWPAETPFQVCVGAILTQNTAWRNVERAMAGLEQHALLEPSAMLAVPRARLAEIIRPAGFLNVKSERLLDFCRWLMGVCGGDFHRLAERDWREVRGELLAVRGIGRETADAILLYALGQPTFVVDAYTIRLFTRCGLLESGAGYEAVRELFMTALPADVELFNEYHALIVAHGKECCRPRPRCGCCVLRDSGCCAGEMRGEG